MTPVPSNEDDYRITYVELQRVLHVMENDDYNQTLSQTPAAWYQARADHCRLLWQKLQTLQQQRSQSSFDSRELEKRVMRACQKSDQATAGSSNQQDANETLRQLLFPSRATRDQKQNNDLGNSITFERDSHAGIEREDMDDGTSGADSDEFPVVSGNGNGNGNQTARLNPEELQEQQREQMEEAIRQMASQMKQETARIHQTLRNQAANLDELENVTTKNVDEVSKVAENVSEHVKQGWSKAFGTWTMIFALAAVFCFTLLTILMAPKRRDMPCIFFCPRSPPISKSRQRTNLEESDRFCRVLRDGTQECLPQDSKWRRSEKESSWSATASASNNDQVASCQLNVNGECEEELHDQLDHLEGSRNLNAIDHDNCQRGKESIPYENPAEKEEEEEKNAHATEGTEASEQALLDQALDDLLNKAQKGQGIQSAKLSVNEDETETLGQAVDNLLNREKQEREHQQQQQTKVNEASEQEMLDQALNDLLAQAQQQRERPNLENSNPGRVGNMDHLMRSDEEQRPGDTTGDTKNAEQELNKGINAGLPKKVEQSGDPFASQHIVPDPSASIPVFRGRPFSRRDVRRAAADGDVQLLEGYIKVRPQWAQDADSNGWTVWHLAARQGNEDSIRVLKAYGDGGMLLQSVDGRTARDVAEHRWGRDHPLVQALSSP